MLALPSSQCCLQALPNSLLPVGVHGAIAPDMDCRNLIDGESTAEILIGGIDDGRSFPAPAFTGNHDLLELPGQPLQLPLSSTVP